MISLRLPADLENKINSLAKAEGKSRSEIVTKSIAEYIQRHAEKLTPYELGKDLFGVAEDGASDLASNRKNYLKKIVQKKNARR